MRSLLAITVVVAACGKRAPDQAAPAPAPVAAPAPAPIIDAAPPPPDAHEAAFAHDPSADLRALGAALDEVDVDAARAWLDRARQAHVADRPFDEPIPDDVAKVGALLVEWDRSGSVARLDCGEPAGAAAMLFAPSVALEGATGADDPIVHAVMRFGHALESRDNAPLAIELGIALAGGVATWRLERGLPETDDMRAFAPTDELPRRAALAEVRCAELQLAAIRAQIAADPDARDKLVGARREDGLDSDDDVIATDAGAAAAYLAETRATIERTPIDAALRDALDRRGERAVMDSHSELARVVAVPYAFRHTQDAISQYREIATGHAPTEP